MADKKDKATKRGEDEKIIISEDLARLFEAITQIDDDPENIVDVADIDPEEYAQFMKERGLEDDEDANRILISAQKRKQGFRPQ